VGRLTLGRACSKSSDLARNLMRVSLTSLSPRGDIVHLQESDDAARVETFNLDRSTNRVTRTVLGRDGTPHHTRLDLALAPGRLTQFSAADAFHGAVLRGATPRAKLGGEEVSVTDLFSGCGGLSVGVAEACVALGRPVRHTLAVDTDADSLIVYQDNHLGAEVHHGPVEDILDGGLGESLTRRERVLSSRLSGLTIALGGPPCQGHSDLNNHTRRADPKNALYLRMARFAEVVRPLHMIIENVPGVAHDREGVVTTTESLLRGLGYTVSTAVIPAAAIGVPQTRKRHLLLATLRHAAAVETKELVRSFALPTRSVMWAIEDLSEEPHLGAFGTPASHSATNRSRIEYLFANGLYDLPNELRPDCHRLKPHSYKAVYGRMRPGDPAPTITSGFGSTGQGRFVHPYHARTLTPHEAARVQGFPDSFSFRSVAGRRSLQRLIGNAVPTRLAYCAGMSLLR
jgi:DNA (cytosine-5)-methyltransferase 1